MDNIELDKRDVELIRQGGNKLEIGISGIYRRYYQPFINFYKGKGHSESNAEDMVQEVFIKVVRKIDTYRGDSPLYGWLWTIAKNTRINVLRKKVDTPIEDETLHYLIDDKNISKDHIDIDIEAENSLKYTECLQDAFNEYENKHIERANFLMLLVENSWSTSEAAEYLGRTLGATREYLSQCRKKLVLFNKDCERLLMV